jgi:hypothetical protein
MLIPVIRGSALLVGQRVRALVYGAWLTRVDTVSMQGTGLVRGRPV